MSIGTGNNAVNTYHYSADGSSIFGGTPSAVVAQANTAISQLRTMYTALCTAGLVGTWTVGSVVTHHQTGQPTSYVAATPLNSTPTSGTITAYQLACVISWKTGLAGRSYRGRSFIGPLRSAATSMPFIAGAFVTAAQNAATALIAAPGVGDLVPAVYSSTLDQTHRITQAWTTDAMRTMRSRAS